ncbi:MAG: hypothetical protein M1827_002985 [Pycnora praestabilis]|nr:MAG: hypothetical protein M1827_002985 [Pycnora praestabilis]
MSILGLILCGAFATALLYPILVYVADRKKLRRFPSPSVAAFTPLWAMYYSWFGRRYMAVNAAHQRLGPVVRIAPNHISFTDPTAYKDIYGHGSSIIKDHFYSNMAAGNPSMADTTSRDEHTRKRKNVTNVFSAKEITAMEPRVMTIVEKLLKNIKMKSQGMMIADTDCYAVHDGKFDLRPWLNMFSYDAITSMFWSNSYGFLDKGNDSCPAMTPEGRVMSVHAMDTFHSGVGFSIWLAHLPTLFYNLGQIILKQTHGKRSGDNFTSMARYQVVERIRSPPAMPDLFSKLPVEPSDKRPIPMSVSEIIAECTTMMNAGNDTTQTSLTNCMYQLSIHPEKQRKLRTALTKTLKSKDQPIAHYADLQKVQYLRACLDESFRCRPPVGFGLPRRTVEPGSTIAGHFIPAGVTVSAPLYNIHKDESLFRDASKFIPERWLADSEYDASENERQNLKDYVLPFSLGGRACVGRNLAYMELSIAIASLVMAFDWELAEPGSEMKIFERLNSNPVALMVKARAREQVWNSWTDKVEV